MCKVLEQDPDLAELVPDDRRALALETCVAPMIEIERGPWTPPPEAGADVLGLLVIDGVLIRKIAVGNRFAVLLVGSGDLVRPWYASPIPGANGLPMWSAYSAGRAALLDASFSRQIAPFPEIAAGLIQRVINVNRDISVNMAIASHTRVDSRVHMLLWQMANRWGRMRPDGVLLPLKLTHQLLGDLVAARRPTVTTALSDLTARGLIEQRSDGWLLLGDPPHDTPES